MPVPRQSRIHGTLGSDRAPDAALLSVCVMENP